MATYGPSSLIIEFDNSGGTLQNMSNYVREVNGAKIEAILVESQAFGDSWFESLATGIKKMNDVTMRGFYDDTATTGPDAIFNAPGNTTTRTLKFTWGGTKTTSVETVIVSYERIPALQNLTMFECIVRPSGAVTEV